jgi:hypothetical protein
MQGKALLIAILLLSSVASPVLAKTGPFGSCTGVAAAPPATKDNNTYIAWNLDLYRELFLIPIQPILILLYILGISPFVVVQLPGGYKCVTLFGFIPILNEKGLALTLNAVPLLDEGKGWTHFHLMTDVMWYCATVKEAAERMKSSPRYAPGPGPLTITEFLGLNYLFADAQGGIASVEATHSDFYVFYGKNGITAQTNVHQFLKGYCPTLIELPALTGTTMRLVRAWTLMSFYAGKIDLETIKGIMRDREYARLNATLDPLQCSANPGLRQSICNYGETRFPAYWHKACEEGGLMNAIKQTIFWLRMGWGGTISSFIIQPEKGIIWWAPGNPDFFHYKPFYCADLLGMEGGASGRNPMGFGLLNTVLRPFFCGSIYEILITFVIHALDFFCNSSLMPMFLKIAEKLLS